MKFSNKTKNILKSALCVVLVVATVLGVASLFSRKDDLKEIHPVFSIGGLTELGKYAEQDNTIYTKEAFECEDLRIEVDFEKTITYRVFFYADNGEFISSTKDMTENFVSDVPDGAVFARVLITPDWEALEVEKEDRVISWLEIAKYSNQLTIKVAAESKKTDKETNETVTDLAGTTWVINSVNVASGLKTIGDLSEKIGSITYYSTLTEKYYAREFNQIKLGYEEGNVENEVSFIQEDGSAYSTACEDMIITFYSFEQSTDADLIDFMLENATLLNVKE